MYSLGIIKGSSDGSGKLYFNPTANVSRQEAVTMLGRLTEKGYAQGRAQVHRQQRNPVVGGGVREHAQRDGHPHGL